MPECFLAAFSTKPCHGRIVAAHLLPKQLLKRVGHDPWDERALVPACGGIVGLSGHHGLFDAYKLTVPRSRLPAGVLRLAEELGLEWYLDRRFGPEKPAVRRDANGPAKVEAMAGP